MAYEWRHGAYLMTTDRERLDLERIHGFLESSYWAAGIPAQAVRRSVENSLAFGVFKGGEQVGFARVVTDYATFAYLADVFVLEPHRGRGLAKWMMEVVFSHPELQGLRRWILATRDAHGLYRRCGLPNWRTRRSSWRSTQPTSDREEHNLVRNSHRRSSRSPGEPLLPAAQALDARTLCLPVAYKMFDG
jgi:GNAT superfamily N-acetyltransferase